MPVASACRRACDGSPCQGNASATGLDPSSTSERASAVAHRSCDGSRVHVIRELEVAGHHRQVLQRQLVGLADGDRIAADLHRELRGPDDGGADALAGVPDRRQVAALRQHVGERVREIAAEIAEASLLALVEIFGDAAGEGQRVDALGWRAPAARHRSPAARCDSASGVRRSIMRMTSRTMRATMRSRSAAASGLPSDRSMPRLLATSRAGSSTRTSPLLASSTIRRPPTAMAAVARMCALLDQRELGRAAADVDVEQRRAVPRDKRDGAGAVRRQLAFHVVAGRGADELAGFLGEQVGDGARIVPLDRLAGEDDRAAVDIGRARGRHIDSSRR